MDVTETVTPHQQSTKKQSKRHAEQPFEMIRTMMVDIPSARDNATTQKKTGQLCAILRGVRKLQIEGPCNWTSTIRIALQLIPEFGNADSSIRVGFEVDPNPTGASDMYKENHDLHNTSTDARI
jgi:hypothetical protein